MNVAITGGTGFIGRRLVLSHLDRGDEVRLLSRKSGEQSGLPKAVKCYQGDLLSDGGNLTSFVDNIDVLYHCAGQLTDWRMMRRLHVNGTQNLIKASENRISHWVQLSSVGVYGPVLDGTVTEESSINPVGEYEVTKAESDQLVLNAAKQGKFSCSILRPSNVFGGDMKNQSLFSMIKMIDRGLFFFIGNRGASANYIHVGNVVEGLIMCGTNPAAKDKIYNLSDHLTIEDFVKTISEALGRSSPMLRFPELPMRWASMVMGMIPGLPLTPARVSALTNRSIYPTDRIQGDLGYTHVMPMVDGLHQLIAAYKRK